MNGTPSFLARMSSRRQIGPPAFALIEAAQA